MGMTLWSLETYEQIGGKTKSYRIQRGFLLLFIFFPDLALQAACLPILSLRPYVFKSFLSARMPSGSSTNICPSLRSQIRSNNLNPPFAESLVDSVPGSPYGDIGANFSLAIALLQPGQPNIREQYLLRPTSHALTTRMAISKA